MKEVDLFETEVIGIKTKRKIERKESADRVILLFIKNKGEDKFTTRQLERAIRESGIEISKNAVINSVSRMLEKGELYLSLQNRLCVSIKGKQKLNKKENEDD